MLITRITKHIICLGFLLLVACQPIPGPVTPTFTGIADADPILPPSDLEPDPTIQALVPTITPTKPVLPIDSVIQNQCPEISNQFVPGRISGVLVVQERVGQSMLFNLQNGERKFLRAGGPAVSPDGMQLVYFDFDDNTLEHFLVIRMVGDSTQTELPLFDGIFRMIGWHDNQRLLFRMTRDPATDPAPHLLVLFNPFTGEKKTYNRDFPDIDNEVEWDLLGPAVYDQTMNYILYAGLKDVASKTHEYILWDDISKTKIASLPGSSYGGVYLYDGDFILQDGVSNNPPHWSPDNNRVAIIGPASEGQSDTDEIFAITKTGEVQRLTYFASHFEKAKISDLSWSPDGKSIAFWVMLEPSFYDLPQDTYQDIRLAIVNTETLEITYYCIMGDSIGPMNGRPSAEFFGKSIPAPIWSPDSTQVVLESRYASDKSRLVLLNLQDGTAVEIGQNMEPIGWMIGEP